MSSIPVLKWSPVVGNINSSTVLLDSSLGQSWNIRLAGTGPNNQTIYPRVVIVDNMGNNAIVSFTYGLSRYQIPPYVRRTIHILSGQEYILFSVTTGVLTLTFCDFDPELPEEENTVATNISAINQAGGGSSAVYTSWSTTDIIGSLVLSNSNLTMTNNNSSNYNCGRALYPKTTGKYYFEFTLASTFAAIGIANATYNLNNNIPSDNNAMSSYNGDSIHGNGGTFVTLPPFSVGDILRIAVDVGAAKFWASKVGLDWNNNPAADPSSGANAASFAYIAGAVVPVCCLNIPGAGTANFGASPFAGVVPTGFTSGWTQ